MTQHTPEPWKAELANAGYPNTAKFWMVTAGAHGDAITQMPWIQQGILPQDEANASRIVACVNACAGISNVLLESAHGRSLGDKYRVVLSQRDELAEALADLEAWCALATKGELATLSSSRMRARAALAKLK